MSGIDSTLAERGNNYGAFAEHARITQSIKTSMMDSPNWGTLSPDKRECLEMIAHKMGRILNGNPNFKDSWHDIVGYAKLVDDSISSPASDGDLMHQEGMDFLRSGLLHEFKKKAV